MTEKINNSQTEKHLFLKNDSRLETILNCIFASTRISKISHNKGHCGVVYNV